MRANHPDCQVAGIDSDPALDIAEAQAVRRVANVSWKLGSVAELPCPDDSTDQVLSAPPSDVSCAASIPGRIAAWSTSQRWDHPNAEQARDGVVQPQQVGVADRGPVALPRSGVLRHPRTPFDTVGGRGCLLAGVDLG